MADWLAAGGQQESGEPGEKDRRAEWQVCSAVDSACDEQGERDWCLEQEWANGGDEHGGGALPAGKQADPGPGFDVAHADGLCGDREDQESCADAEAARERADRSVLVALDKP